MRPFPRVLLIDPSDAARRNLAERLHLQGFLVIECKDGAEGAVLALQEPPAMVVADLSMPSISGVQLCRLLNSETATAHVPVILRGPEGRRNHFWAEQAGAYAYIVKGRMGELVRALRRAFERGPLISGALFSPSFSDGLDVRERIAAHLDAALFDSVIASELRGLGLSESFDRLVDLLSQFLSQVTTYRWMAVQRNEPPRFGLHTKPERREASLAEAAATMKLERNVPIIAIEDDDAVADPEGPPAICEPIPFGDQYIGTIALAPRAPAHPNDPLLVRTIARELGGALRMATLVEESRLMATIDSLTGLVNRRAFIDWAEREVRRAQRHADALSLVLLDLDHFKQINDRRGHETGDLVLSKVAKLFVGSLRTCDVVARWGGEEFLLALPSTPMAEAAEIAERVRVQVEAEEIVDRTGQRVPVTASFGVTQLNEGESIEQLVDRADRAMYMAKSNGRNLVVCAPASGPIAPKNGRPISVDL